MNISERAVEAAARVNEPELYGYLDSVGTAENGSPAALMRDRSLAYARRILEAAAPLIAAQAWDEGARAALDREHAYGAAEKAKYANPYREAGQ